MTDIIIIGTIIAYLILMVTVGFIFSKKNENVGDFYLGGRKLGPLVTAMSAEASDMSSWLLMGLPGVAYLTGGAEAGWTAMMISFINLTDYISQVFILLLSCVVMAFGVLLEVKTEVVFIPGDGFIVAIAKVLKKEFGKVKPYCDVSFVVIAVILSFAFLGYLAGVREGTVISALIIGPIVRIFKKYLGRHVDALIEV